MDQRLWKRAAFDRIAYRYQGYTVALYNNVTDSGAPEYPAIADFVTPEASAVSDVIRFTARPPHIARIAARGLVRRRNAACLRCPRSNGRRYRAHNANPARGL